MQNADPNHRPPTGSRRVISGGPITHERLMDHVSDRHPGIARRRKAERPECRGQPATARSA